jgi:hypothetical protein
MQATKAPAVGVLAVLFSPKPTNERDGLTGPERFGPRFQGWLAPQVRMSDKKKPEFLRTLLRPGQARGISVLRMMWVVRVVRDTGKYQITSG